MLGIPNLKLLFEDDDFIAILYITEGKFTIHSVNKNEMTVDRLKKAVMISDLIDNKFLTLGVDKLYTWAEESDQDRYNKFLGYKPTGEVIKTIKDGGVLPDDYPKEVREYIKELK